MSSTPIRQLLLKPKIKSPLSPCVGHNKANVLVGKYLRVDSQCKSRNFVKSLNFETASQNVFKSSSSSSLIENLNCEIDKNNNVKVHVEDYSSNLLFINSPNKYNLMQNGLSNLSRVHILGKGSFGTVLLGMYKGKNIAVKIIKLDKNGLFLRESNVLHFNHRNIVKVIEVIQSVNANYGLVLMEYLMSSRHLQSILDDEKIKLSQEIVIKYGMDICGGLGYCHKNDLLHLDLKPSNILVNQHGTCKLCDFGNSVKLDDTTKWKGQHATVAYAAPELLLGKPPTVKCDLYSLGILLWQMRFRKSPYAEIDSIETIIYKVIKFHYRPDSASDLVYDSYARIYIKCWEANPENRPEIHYVMEKLQMAV